MIILIHGKDATSSRKILYDEKSKRQGYEIIAFDGKKVQLEDLVLACESSSLLSTKKLLVLENLFYGGITKSKVSLFDYLTRETSAIEILIWEEREIEKAVINKYFKDAKIINSKIPANIFSFLDSIGLTSKSSLLSNFHILVKQIPTELFFAMLIRQWRHLIIAKDLGVSGLGSLAPWQANKFMRQAKVFSLDKLLTSYRLLLNIDYQIKLGQTPYSLDQLLDIFFISL